MAAIPEDVKVAANVAFNLSYKNGEVDVYAALERAILAERKRCERIAKRVWRDADFYDNVTVRRAVSLIRCRIETGAPQ